MRTQMLQSQDMFVPLVHAPGEAQTDFGEALVVVAGLEQKAHYLATGLPRSDDGSMAAFPGRDHNQFGVDPQVKSGIISP